MKQQIIPGVIALLSCVSIVLDLSAQGDELRIKSTPDFELTGTGGSSNWASTDWVSLPQRGGDGTTYQTDAKLLYSQKGIYCLFRCEDQIITSTLREDFSNLFTEDVVEIFFWPNESMPVYFEYELSPYNYELPIIVPNDNGTFLGWRPWNYEGERLTRRKANISELDGDKTWTVEFFIPYDLLRPLVNEPPEKGSKWRMNMYRLDYDKGQARWTWQPIRKTFHDYERYGTMIFD
ncbi:MAG: carbohydrate-binding family 9-like protein [Bacteroidetes bacterium]|nr:carbohydrate-binding family 9-like protein [Bacteroidota bacterium]MDA1120129.1 carbohydrate-binding family 9-like protein [Bacteroidota bacterium]